jgi:hypothetical protein
MMFRAGPDSPKPKRRIDADPVGWQRLRDDLHILTLEHGPTWLDLSRKTDVCPAGVGGRGYELWQPLLALAWWLDERGAKCLLPLMQRFALEAIAAGQEDQTPEADEVILEVLAELVQNAIQPPTPGEILKKAKEHDPATFDRWQAQTVSRRLKNYGIPPPKKSHGERRYRNVTVDTLRRIQRNYGIDLGIPELAEAPDSSPPIAPRALQTARNA